MANLTQFRARFPEFTVGVLNDTLAQMYLDDASLQMGTVGDLDPGTWLVFFDVAHNMLAAHYATIWMATSDGDGAPKAPVKKREVDDTMVEYAISSISPTMDDLYSTAYGKRYRHYRRICFAGPLGA